mmetsp:Transcript_90055/g.291444  ORF Transcript_90055/g.291444 Transcript_90055/m.291444 type:complete len:218 (-) Transcript_90055:1351-2004(-)
MAWPQAFPQVVNDMPHAPGIGDPLDQATALCKNHHVKRLHLQVSAPCVRILLQQLVYHDAELHHPRVLAQVTSPFSLAQEGVQLAVIASESQFLRSFLSPEHVNGLQTPFSDDHLWKGIDCSRFLVLVPQHRNCCRHLGLQGHQDPPLVRWPGNLPHELWKALLQAHGRCAVGGVVRGKRVEVCADLVVHDHGPVDVIVAPPDLEKHVLPQLLVVLV